MFHSASLAGLLALGLLAKRVIAASASTPRSDASISWGSCESFGVNGTDTNYECAYFEIPMDYHDSSAGNARLAVIKLAATRNKLGTVFFNPGGPGNTGIRFLTARPQMYSEYFQGSFDIITWDPRGVGYTFPGPVYCFNSTEEDANFWNYTPVKYINETISGSFDERDLNELYSKDDLTERKFKEFAAHCQDGPSGPYLKYLGTSSTVRDLVSLGDAILGEGEPINFWGISYGSVVGFNFINMFPERVGHVVLDGVVDPTVWISYKFLSQSFVDIEKTYSGLTDGCAKAGRAGCKLIEITGDNASGDDVKALLNYALDVILELYLDGYQVPVAPGFLRNWLSILLYTPSTWSQHVNAYVYEVVALVLQSAQAHSVTVPGGDKYNVPSENIADPTPPMILGLAPISNPTVYSNAAIAGADDFRDNWAKIKDLFDVIVQTTREITPTFGTIWTFGYNSYGWPVRSVEQLPPYNPQKLKNPVILVGNSVDPLTPFVGTQKAANMLGDNAFVIKQLGFGHTSIGQPSSCTIGIMFSYFANGTLPQGRIAQCPVDETNLFPALNGTTTTS